MPDKEEKDTTWQVRVRPNLDKLVDQAVQKDTHSTKSEFIRQAVREKLEKMGFSINLQELEKLSDEGIVNTAGHRSATGE